jgi:hypothetical protein
LNGGTRFDGRRFATLRDRIDRENEHHPVNAEVFVFTIDPIAPVGLRCRPTRRTGCVSRLTPVAPFLRGYAVRSVSYVSSARGVTHFLSWTFAFFPGLRLFVGKEQELSELLHQH